MNSKRSTDEATGDNDDQDDTGSAAKDVPRSATHFPRQAEYSNAHEERATTHALALANALAHDETEDNAPRTGAFPHENLDVYRVAVEMAAIAKNLAAQIPRGHRSIADHLLRAASNTVLLCAEGANRRGAAQKRQRFVESRGECGEVAAAADLIVVLQIGNTTRALKMKRLASRVSAMLTRLIAKQT